MWCEGCFATQISEAPLLRMKTWKQLWPFLPLPFPSPPLSLLTTYAKLHSPSLFSLSSTSPSPFFFPPSLSPILYCFLSFPFLSANFPPGLLSPFFSLESFASETHFRVHLALASLTRVALTHLDHPYPLCLAGFLAGRLRKSTRPAPQSHRAADYHLQGLHFCSLITNKIEKENLITFVVSMVSC